MVTWTTYGTWLQGDARGYVKEGKILQGNVKLKEICQKLQKQPAVILNKAKIETVQQVILKEAEKNRTGHKNDSSLFQPRSHSS